MRHHAASPRTALTLIEMIVVIACCFVLAGLMLPVLLRSRESARAIVCQGNLGTVGVAFGTVLSGESGYFTNAYYDLADLQNGKYWVGTRTIWNRPDPLTNQQFAKSLLCPSARGAFQFVGGVNQGNPVHIKTSYAHNVEMPLIANNISRVAEPVNRVIMYDGDPAAVVGKWEHTMNWAEKTIVRRHHKQANFLFLDGHVEMRGDFRAEPFHGCPMGRTPAAYDTLLSDVQDRPGLAPGPLLAAVDLHPESNNVKNQGNTVQCKITLTSPLSAPVDASAIYLVGVAGQNFARPIQATPPISIKLDSNGSTTCQVKFDRQMLYDQMRAGNHFGHEIPIKIVGALTNGTPFEGVDPNAFFYPPENKL